MEKSPSEEGNRTSATQEIPKGLLPHSQEPATYPYSDPDQASPSPHPNA